MSTRTEASRLARATPGGRSMLVSTIELTAKIAFCFFCIATSVERLIGQAVYPSRSQPAPAPDVQQEVRLLREEVSALRAEVGILRQQIQRSPSQAPEPGAAAPGSLPTPVEAAPPAPVSAPTTGPVPQQQPAEAPTNLIQAQVAELAQTKAESSSKMPLKIYGTILSTTFFNTRAIDWPDQPNRVLLPSEVTSNTGSFSSSLRQSRIGLLIDGPTIGRFKASGTFALDFNGGQTDFQTSSLFGLANIVYAYARLESPRTAIEAGQDEAILAPRSPTSLVAFSWPELYRTGNLYIRAPQVRIEQKVVNNKTGVLKLTGGLVAPVGNYPVFENPNPSPRPPLGWQRPAVQARLSWQSASLASGNDTGWELGVSGHYGRVGVGAFSVTSWATSFDFKMQGRHFGVDGEGYMGKNLQAFGGGIGQPGKTLGGFAEVRFLSTSRLQFNTGWGTDHLTDFDRIAVPINRNSAVYANTIYQFTPEVGASLEYRYMFTKPFAGALRTNNNVNLGIAYSF